MLVVGKRILSSYRQFSYSSSSFLFVSSLISSSLPFPNQKMSTTSSSSIAYSPLVANAAARVTYASKVPSDIDISQSVAPIHISKIAEDAGKLIEQKWMGIIGYEK